MYAAPHCFHAAAEVGERSIAAFEVPPNHLNTGCNPIILTTGCFKCTAIKNRLFRNMHRMPQCVKIYFSFQSNPRHITASNISRSSVSIIKNFLQSQVTFKDICHIITGRRRRFCRLQTICYMPIYRKIGCRIIPQLDGYGSLSPTTKLALIDLFFAMLSGTTDKKQHYPEIHPVSNALCFPVPPVPLSGRVPAQDHFPPYPLCSLSVHDLPFALSLTRLNNDLTCHFITITFFRCNQIGTQISARTVRKKSLSVFTDNIFQYSLFALFSKKDL